LRLINSQEERQRTKEKSESEVESTSNSHMDMPLDQILEAESRCELRERPVIDTDKLGMSDICQAADKQLFQLVEWAKVVPHFTELGLTERVVLLSTGKSIRGELVVVFN
jgi:DNA-binding TFAR19-related protein (PDSD5 family)